MKQVINLGRIDGEEGKAGVELPPRTSRRLIQFVPQYRIDPTTVFTHRPNDLGHLWCVRIQESLHQTGCLGGLLILDDLATNSEPDENAEA
jgi:hypothetical protein